MDITITIPDASAARILNGYAKVYGFDPNNAEGETKPAFCKRMLINHIKQTAMNGENMIARETAQPDFDAVELT